MAVERELIEFDRGDLTEVTRRLDDLAEGAWMNIEPIVDDDDLAQLRETTPHPILRIFSAKGRPIPFATVVVQHDGLAVGLEHSRGARVVPELREYGVRAPSSWEQQQDHPKRGVVYAVPRDESPDVLLAWILDAATAVSGVPIRGRWSAVIARRV